MQCSRTLLHRPFALGEEPLYNLRMMPEARVAAPVSADTATRLAADSRAFVLKVMHPAREDAFVDMQCGALTHLAARAPQLALPRVIPSAKGSFFTRMAWESGTSRLVWMLSFLPGATLAETQPHAPELLRSLGRLLGEMDLGLLDFAHPATQRFLKWDLARSNWARDYLGHIASTERRVLAKKFLNLFEEEAVPLFPHLRRSVIYGDANDHNALVDPQHESLHAYRRNR